MTWPSWLELLILWSVWGYPFIFRAPHGQKRASITVAGATRAGVLLEALGVFIAFAARPAGLEFLPLWRIAASLVAGCAAITLSWTAVLHLGRQFRIQAGLYHDHQLVRTGPYSLVRHPIYASLLAILVMTLLLQASWRWAAVSLAVFISGTEIRVRTEDRLLASRFGEEFARYRKSVPAYIPFVR